jgi:hypothetical protein
MCIIGCKKANTYNLEGLNPKYCCDHKTIDMINTKHERCEECAYNASFGFLIDNKRVRCSTHKLDGMINLKHKNIRCKDATCEGGSNIVEGYCSVKCYVANEDLTNTTDMCNLFVSFKEYLVFNNLCNNFLTKPIWDKHIKGCKFRPDFLMKFDNCNIIVEVDESQHKIYNKNEELDRINTIHNNLASLPLYVIRFNTDNYDNTKSCFKKNKIINEDDWNNRLQKLNTTINEVLQSSNKVLQSSNEVLQSSNECIDNLESKNNTLETIYLFYDN